MKAASAWSVWLQSVGPRIEEALDNALPSAREKPGSVHRAMRYAVFPGGKRIRPALAVQGFEVAGGRGGGGVELGAALELLHTYSLIHDDLPCMDDDDYRRGRLSCHKKFGEAIAVLAGDALHVLAFEKIARLPGSAARKLRVLQEIAEAVGTFGVIGGQVVDIESEGKKISPATLRLMHERKTGALIRCSLTGGAILAGGSRPVLRRLTEFGDSFGLLFQIVDDLLSEFGSYKVLGRRRGRDRVRGKATYPSILGSPRTRVCLQEALEESLARIPVGGRRGEILTDLIGAVVARLPDEWLFGGPESAR